MPYVTSWERIGMEKGMKIGLEEGWKIGWKEEKLETARRMLNDDLPIPLIARCTGLTEEEVRTLMNLK